MIRSRFQRGAMLASASVLSLGLITAGTTVAATAGATGVPGVTATQVTIGATVPLSGIASGYASVSAAAAAVFKYVNSKGGVNGRKINFIRLDDCYNLAAFGLGCTQPTSTTTLSQTQTLVTTDNVFATVGSLGTAAQDSVRSYLKTNGVPQLFVNSGSSDWNDPTHYAGLYGFQPSYKVESKIFAKYIKAKYAGQTVGFIGQNDDFGANGFAGLTTSTGISVASGNKFLYNPLDALGGASDITPAIAGLKSHNVKVVVLDSIPPVTKAILVAAHNASFAPHWIISSVGSNPLYVNSSLEVGAVTFTNLPATNDTLNPWNKWLRKVLAADHADVPSYSSTKPIDANWQYGAAYAVSFLEALKTAGTAPTQAKLLAAMNSTVFATPGIVNLKYSSTNHQGFLGGMLATVSSTSLIAPIKVPVYLSTDAPTAPVTTTTYAVKAIPTWMA